MISANEAVAITEESKPFWDKYWSGLELLIRNQATAGKFHVDITFPKKMERNLKKDLQELGYELELDEVDPHSREQSGRLRWYN